MDGAEHIRSIVPRVKPPRSEAEREQAAALSGRKAFLDALHAYPIDNRRVGESFRDTFTRGETGMPNPPRQVGAPFLQGGRDLVIGRTLHFLREHYPQALAEYGEQQAALELCLRLDDMERLRIEGMKGAKLGGARKLDWNLT